MAAKIVHKLGYRNVIFGPIIFKKSQKTTSQSIKLISNLILD